MKHVSSQIRTYARTPTHVSCRFATLLIIKTLINMAITIKPALRKNPQDKDAAAKYYAQVVLAPEMTQRQIVEQIADRCTLTGSDIKAVLDALMVVIKRNLANGSPGSPGRPRFFPSVRFRRRYHNRRQMRRKQRKESTCYLRTFYRNQRSRFNVCFFQGRSRQHERRRRQ